MSAVGDVFATPQKRTSPTANLLVGDLRRSDGQAAVEIEDPVAREQALDDAETRLAADFGRAALTGDEIGKINALLDARQ